jgi:hypothetical protein
LELKGGNKPIKKTKQQQQQQQQQQLQLESN